MIAALEFGIEEAVGKIARQNVGNGVEVLVQIGNENDRRQDGVGQGLGNFRLAAP